MSSKECIASLSAHLFWNTDRNEFYMDVCPAYIIQRVLEYDSLKDWQLIYSYYGLDKIVTTCQSLRTLGPKALSFVCGIFKTSKNNINVIIRNSLDIYFLIERYSLTEILAFTGLNIRNTHYSEL